MWSQMPDPLLFYIFSHLSAKDLLRSSQTCWRWNQVAKDEFLWKRLLYHDFKIDPSIPRYPGKNSWYGEYKRLRYHTPIHETEVLTAHTNQVLHVSFSHDGKRFATSSKDGYIKVWESTYPAKIIYEADMKHYEWNYTQFSQFNESDTLLLVSGVHFGNHTTSGEIAVFSIIDGFTLQCRVLNKPYDIFGTWYTDQFLLSGRLHFLGHLVSCSFLWLNKACQESDSEKKPIIQRLFKFYNKNASSIRTILVANCLTADKEDEASTSGAAPVMAAPPNKSAPRSGNPASCPTGLSSSQWERAFKALVKVDYGAESSLACTMDSPIRYSAKYHRRSDKNATEEPMEDFEDPNLPWDKDWQELSELQSFHHLSTCPPCCAGDDGMQDDDSYGDDSDFAPEELEKILDPREKFLIFTTGSLTYTPHQIGIKRIKPFKFAEKVKETASLPQRLAERAERQQNPNVSPNWHDEISVAHMFDQVDYVFDFHGHIIGMGLSPDHRYLYVNNRPWPRNYWIENPLEPPPIAQEIDIHVIDLVTLQEVGGMLRSHRAYTPNDECFFIFLDVSHHYVASGAEDKHGYLWDRHYGNCLAKLPHGDVVNSVAFNPADPEMLITASDDFTLKVWRSSHRMNQLDVLVS